MCVLNMNESMDVRERVAYAQRKNATRNQLLQLKTLSTREIAIDNCDANLSYVSAQPTTTPGTLLSSNTATSFSRTQRIGLNRDAGSR